MKIELLLVEHLSYGKPRDKVSIESRLERQQNPNLNAAFGRHNHY